jgi:hypothetical protein
MNEKLLHFIWKFKLFDQDDLRDTDSEPLQVVHQGMHNTNSGADFEQGKVKIGKTLWAGNIELHVNSSDWFAHKHETDPAYNNVILHVVYQQKGPVAVRQNALNLPCYRVMKNWQKERTGFHAPGFLKMPMSL